MVTTKWLKFCRSFLHANIKVLNSDVVSIFFSALVSFGVRMLYENFIYYNMYLKFYLQSLNLQYSV